MNALLKSLVCGTVISLGLASSAALADPPPWAHGGWHRNWDHERDFDRDHDRDRWHHDDDYAVRAAPQYRDAYRTYVDDVDYARVVAVEPIVRRVAVESPQRDCWVEDRQVYGEPRSHTPAVLGAIIGGVIGHQFGSGHSRNAATVAGAVLGGSIGHDASARTADIETRAVERCQVRTQTDWQDRIDGYRVSYVYRGRQYCTTMAYNPGNRVQVRVGVDMDVVR